MRLSKHFRSHEFECPCCGRVEMDPVFINMLEQTRVKADFRFDPNSGFRCPDHNQKVHGAKNSAHLRGLAADIKCYGSHQRWKLIDSAIEVGFTRIGIGASFIHLDCDQSLPNPRIWVY